VNSHSSLIFAFLLIFIGLWPIHVLAQQGEPKKLIYYGWGSPDSFYVRDHWKQMEEMPFDGTAFVVPIDRRAWQQGNRDTRNQLGWEIMGRRVFRVNDFHDAIADLKAAKWSKLHDNFIPVPLSASQSAGGLTWFDDERWRTIVNNFEVLAKIAAESGVKGLIFDPEPYRYKLFEYPAQRQRVARSFESYTQIARLRGQQVMNAIASAMPQVKILSLYGYSAPFTYLRPGTNLANVEYGLLPAFYDGLLEALPAEGRLIDGYEPAYNFKQRSQFLDGYKQIKDARSLSSLPELYDKKVSAGFGLWIDYKKNPHYFTPQEFEKSVQDALDISDTYVWIYSEGPEFFPPKAIAPSYIEAMAKARAGGKRK
jgi:hypothetical protein